MGDGKMSFQSMRRLKLMLVHQNKLFNIFVY